MKERFAFLLKLYVDGSISSADQDEFFRMLSGGDYDEIVRKHFEKTVFEDDLQKGEELPHDVSEEMIRQIIGSSKSSPVLPLKKKTRLYGLRWAVAASAILVIAISVYLLERQKDSGTFIRKFVTQSSQKTINTSNGKMSVLLPDGSRIDLQPRSSLFYSKDKFEEKREVYLEGEAFFDIAKNPRKPFYVYYNKVVTKVLGTSFNIRTDGISGNIEVEVRTGKVQVYENENMVDNDRKSMSLIITPNQKAIYKAKDRFFETTLVEHPVPVYQKEEQEGEEVEFPGFVFENARLYEIFKQLEEAYGIEIVVSNEEMYQCVFSGDFTKQNLYDGLKIICLATNADFEINGTRILIKGNGCE
ncbi:MAG: FecR family protein [Chitinophagaceae bacterium]|nr:FecR family protein [Chitinophagaceae bacterium]